MSPPSRPLLLTRPKADSEPLAERIAAAAPDLQVVISPLMRIEPRRGSVRLADCDAVVFTSRNAVRATVGAARSNAMPAHCVGPKTALAARRAGFVTPVVESSAAALAARIADMQDPGRLLYLRGAHVTINLAGQLAAKGIQVDEEIVYDQISLPLGRQAIKALNSGACVATAYSRRTAILFNDRQRQSRHAHIVHCLSRKIARAVSPQFRPVVASDRSEGAIARELVALARNGIASPRS